MLNTKPIKHLQRFGCLLGLHVGPHGRGQLCDRYL